MADWMRSPARYRAWELALKAWSDGCTCALCRRMDQYQQDAISLRMMEGYIALYSTMRMHLGSAYVTPLGRRAMQDAAGDQGPILPADRSPA